MQTLKKLLFLFIPYESKQVSFLIMMIVIISVLEMVGVASILPFVAVLMNPNVIETNNFLNYIFKLSDIIGVKNNQEFIFVLGALIFLLLIISLTLKAFVNYVQLKFIKRCEYNIGKRLLEGYLNQPYSWFLLHNSSNLGKNILSEVDTVISLGISPLIELISKGSIAIALIILLVLVDPKIAFIVGLSLTLSYAIVFYFVRNHLSRTGKERFEKNRSLFSAVSEAFGATKEIKIGGLEKVYINYFMEFSKNIKKNDISSMMISSLPRFFFEAIAFGGILLIILFSMDQKNSFNTILPIISLYIFAGYRLMPTLQQIYAAFTNIAYVGSSLNKLHEHLQNYKPLDENQKHSVLSFGKTIKLKNIHYNYPNTSQTILKNVSLTISAKTTVGLIGTTGSGKTTTVDIISGLLEAQKGTLEIDGKVITKINLRSWQRSIGYVPQHIYLSHNTLAANIAFGVQPRDINQEKVEQTAKIASLHEFIINELPKKYQTVIGERGVRLSGGQRQRIGIARALYHNPKVLILDEATNALDYLTEKEIMENINNINKGITVILITHRLTTVKNCDKIFLLSKGKLIAKGKFKDIEKQYQLLRDKKTVK